MRTPRSHGTGLEAIQDPSLFGALGADVVIEPGALVFHPENVHLGDRVYVGHYAMLKAYYKNELRVGDGTWIGQAAFLHGAGGIEIGCDVGIGPHVCILTSTHGQAPAGRPIMEGPLELAPVRLHDGCDLGVGCVILPGVTVFAGAQVGAGAVVTRDVPAGAVVAGNPARVLRFR